ncbi:MAG: N-glycosylase/DNA lyase [Candidatus Aminicenantia bacterium]
MYSNFTIERENAIEEIKKLYLSVENEIRSRLNKFNRIWKTGKEEEIFAELIFCILTPQSKAKSCWAAVENLLNKNVLLKGNKNQLVRELNEVRFKYKKAKYIIEARKQFSIDGKVSIKSKIGQFSDAYDTREWLIQNVKGIGYKEASHFLRNIGFGEDLAILDRHILKNLKLLGVIERIPSSLSKRRYFEIEKKMKEFATKVNIPMSRLDLVLWYKETGEIFK